MRKKIYFLIASAVVSASAGATDHRQTLAPTDELGITDGKNKVVFPIVDSTQKRVPSKSASTDATITLSVEVVADNGADWQVENVYAFSIETGQIYYVSDFNESFPAGKYDMAAVATHKDRSYFQGYDFRAAVVMEELDLTSDQTVSFDLSTATNEVSFIPVLKNGEQMKLPVLYYTDDWEEVPVSDGNAEYDGLTFIYMLSAPEWSMDQSITMSPVVQESTPYGKYDPYDMSRIFVNDLSPRITLNMGMMFELGGEETCVCYTRGAVNGLDGNVALSNSASTFKDLTFNPSWTPWGADTGDMLEDPALTYCYPYGINFARCGNSTIKGQYSAFSSMSKNPDIYNICYSDDENPVAALDFIISPMKGEVYPDEWGSYNEIDNVGERVSLFSQGDAFLCALAPDDFVGGTGDGIMNYTLPGAPAFTAPYSDVKVSAFSTSPALVSYVDTWGYPQYDIISNRLKVFYTGRINDKRYTDIHTLECEMTVNGETAARNYQEIENWWNSNGRESKDKITVKLKNDNFEVDDIRGGNEATISIDLGKEDYNAPTLTMLQFRDENNLITSEFNKGADGQILLSATDLRLFDATPETDWTFTYGSQKVDKMTVEYALHGTGEFNEMEISEDEDAFYPVFFGSLYKGSLECAEKSGWYDLRISLEDASGNSQQQTIKCAFKVNNDETGIDGVKDSTSNWMVFNLQGIRIMETSDRSQINNLPKGIYIINGTKTAIR